MDKSKIDILCEYLNNNVAERYQIANAALEDNTGCFFNSCEEVMLSNCRFENFLNRTLFFDDINLLLIVVYLKSAI